MSYDATILKILCKFLCPINSEVEFQILGKLHARSKIPIKISRRDGNKYTAFDLIMAFHLEIYRHALLSHLFHFITISTVGKKKKKHPF